MSDAPRSEPDMRDSSSAGTDQERAEGESDLSWKGPVIAAIVGALIVSVFVIYAIVSDSPEKAATAVVFPPGYTQVTADAAVKVAAVAESMESTLVAVSTGSGDFASLDVALWEYGQEDGGHQMVRQYSSADGPGNVTISFPVIDEDPFYSELIAYVAFETIERTVSADVETSGTRRELSDLRIDMGGGSVVVIKSLIVGDGWGNVEWIVEGGGTAKVATEVSFNGDADATLIGRRQQVGERSLFNFGDNEGLVSDGGRFEAAGSATSVTVEFHVTVPSELSGAIVVELP